MTYPDAQKQATYRCLSPCTGELTAPVALLIINNDQDNISSVLTGQLSTFRPSNYSEICFA